MRILFILFICMSHLMAQDWRCPERADRARAYRAVDSLSLLRYPTGQFIFALGDSKQGPVEAQNAARIELVKKISGRVTFQLRKVTNGQYAQEASQLSQSAHFDHMPLLRSDPDLICEGAGFWIAQASLRLQDYTDILKRSYEDSASIFRVNVEQALRAKDLKSFTSSWKRAQRLQASVVSQGLFLVALLADASRGASVDISSVLEPSSFPPFLKDMELWQEVQRVRELRMRESGVYLQSANSARYLSPKVANHLSAKGLVLKERSKGSYILHLRGSEQLTESAYGGIWTCMVQGQAEILDPRGTSLGHVVLNDESWRDFAPGDSLAACTKAWAKVEKANVLGRHLDPLMMSLFPLD